MKKVTGTHYGLKDPISGKGLIPLKFSKVHAERIFREAELNLKEWAMRGLPRYALRAFLIHLEFYENV